ncbi:MAG: MarR family winged helix-turn-helix transcriptional regulator [Eubacteriales bacterium]
MSEKREILHNAFVIKKAYDSLWDDISEKYKLTRAEIDVIGFLANNPNLDTARNVVEYRMIAKSHVSKAVEQLIERGFLMSSKDSKDRRQIHLMLTDAAKSAVEDIIQRQIAFTEKMINGISEEERSFYLRISEKIAQNASGIMEDKI